MISLRTAQVAALLSITSASALIGGAAPAQTTPTADLFSYSEGATFVVTPQDDRISQMESTPLNLLDDSASTDWTGDGGRAVFVLKLAEETQLSRIAFDTAGLNRDQKAPRDFTIEVSNSSADSGFAQVLSGTLRMAANGQSFAFKEGERPVGHWVRLTILGNHGDDYSGFTGFHGYGRQMTNSASLPNMTGTYEGASGWGWVHLVQQGNQVTGCYEYEHGTVTGVVDGNVLRLDMVDHSSDGGTIHNLGLFQLTPDGRGIRGLVRGNDRASRDAYAAFYSAQKQSNRAGGC